MSAIDDKPKTGRDLSRLRNLERDPRATLLLDLWDEDWTRLGWVMVRGHAHLEECRDAWDLLMERYPQYREMQPPQRVIVLRPERISWWTWS